MQWLKKAEYFSLVSTVVGTTIAAFTQQVVYAVTPMTLTLCLSFRQQKEQQQTIERLQYQVSTLHHQFDLVTLSATSEIQLFEDSLSVASSDLFSTSKNRDRSFGWDRELKVMERLERLELILYRLEETDSLSGNRGVLLLQNQVSLLAQEFNLLLDKIALEHNLHYSELRTTILNESTKLTNTAIAVQAEDIFRLKDELQQLKVKLQPLVKS
jgi:hypothetical protein